MPITSGRKGIPFVGAAPDGGWTPRMSPRQWSLPTGGWTPRRSPGQAVEQFQSPTLSTRAFNITGVTRDSAGAALPNCVVQLFRAVDDFLIAESVSDGSGNYSFGATAGPYYIVAYKAGSPDVAGTTVNTLVGS